MREKYRQLLEQEEKQGARIIVCGAGTVGQQVIVLGKQLGFTVLCLEDREEYAKIAEKLGADQVICRAFREGFDVIDDREDDYYVVMTREHKYDKDCLEQILDKKKAYVGMMASKNRGAILKERLLSDGMSEEEVKKIHSPIGLAISAETPAEIAVSVFAEIIQIRNSQKKNQAFDKEILKAIVEGTDEVKMILATIVKKEGSAPRDVGTRMLIKEDGSKIGSVGGGFIEAEVLELAKKMFVSGEKEAIYETAKDSYEAKLCGGYETITLERV